MSNHGINSERKRSLHQRLARRDGPSCWMCGARLRVGSNPPADAPPPTLDHIQPASRGGSNAAVNLRLACEPCNLSRRDAPAHPLTPRQRRLLEVKP